MKVNRQETIVAKMMSMVQAPLETQGIFRMAFIHGSWMNEHPQSNSESEHIESNERLEFLGDSVLGLIIADALYRRFPLENEGALSKAKARLVSTPTLVRLAKKMEIGKGLLLGKGEEISGGRKRESLLADALEALIGAVFYSMGFGKVKLFVLDLWEDALKEEFGGLHSEDFKTTLQEYSQNLMNELPSYKVLETIGPDHEREYVVAVYMRACEMGRGCGKSKKMAEQMAAAEALRKIKKESFELGEAT